MLRFVDQIVKALADHMIETKENMDSNLIASLRDGNMVNYFELVLIISNIEIQNQVSVSPVLY